jgi:hypothetical protein
LIDAFWISRSTQLEFIPLDILTEFPNLSGLLIKYCYLPTVKSGLFKPELRKVVYLYLGQNRIEAIEPEAFQHLTELKWISLNGNILQTLSYKLFRNNPHLFYIDLRGNKINSIHPNFFDGLNKMKLIDLERNACITTKIGCETCLVTRTELRGKLRGCFGNCANDTNCIENPPNKTNSETKVDQENKNSQLKEVSENLSEILELISRDIEKDIEGVESKLVKISNDLNSLVDSLTTKIETSHELSRKITKEAI